MKRDSDEPYKPDEDLYAEEWPRCHTCNGSGTVNPLTAPKGYLCLSVTTCPACEGSGDCL